MAEDSDGIWGFPEGPGGGVFRGCRCIQAEVEFPLVEAVGGDEVGGPPKFILWHR